MMTRPPPVPRGAGAMTTGDGAAALRWLRVLGAILDQATCLRNRRPAPLETGLDALLLLWSELASHGGSIYWIGNGGTAALVSHMSQDVLNQCGIRSMTLNDPSLITCMANDFGYENVFRRPLEVMATKGDLLIAVSSSGESENIVSAAKAALDAGLRLVTLSAFSSENRLRALSAELSFHVPVNTCSHAELAHEALLHAVVDTFKLRRTC